jgi:Lrp/AsnC family transcriptional regulator, leucine-responsive regulatory protein
MLGSHFVSNPMPDLDSIDRRILRELQRDGAIRNDVLAERVGLSPSPTLRRVKALEEAGYVRSYVALLNPSRLGLGVRVLIEIRLTVQDRDALDRFEKAVSTIAEVTECMTVLGDWDYVLTVVAKDIEDYQRVLLDRLAKIPGVANYKSTLIVRDVKRSTELPV